MLIEQALNSSVGTPPAPEPGADKWVRPSDWPELGTPTDNQIIILITTQWNRFPYECFSLKANTTFAEGMSVTVDWGDGNTEAIELPAGEIIADALGHYYYDTETYAWNKGPVLNNGAHVFVIKITLPDNVYLGYSSLCKPLDIHIGANVQFYTNSLSNQKMLEHVKFFGSGNIGTTLEYSRALCSVETVIPFQTVSFKMFGNCFNLRNFDFSACREIGDSAFYQSGISGSVNAPLLETVGKSAFYECTRLGKVESPLLSRVKNSAFGDCCLLESISHAENWTVESSAFNNCMNYYDNPHYDHPVMDRNKKEE